MMTRLLILILGLILTFGVYLNQAGEAKTLFEDDFSKGTDKWDLVDNGGKISLTKGDPPEFGPDVLSMESPGGINVLVFIKSGFDDFEDGIIEVLWRDKEIADGAVADRDADGPLIFRVQGGHIWSEQLYLIEFDADTGFHFDVVGGAGVQGAGPKSEGNWNWIKARIDGDLLQARTWDADKTEPEDWMLELEDKSYESGAIGLRAWSGTVEAAFFRVSDLDGPTLAVDSKQKLATTWGNLKSHR